MSSRETTTTSRAVLLVEDNPNDRLLMQRALRKSKLINPMDEAVDGEQALHYLLGSESEAPHPLPALVLLDLKLPKVDGLEVLNAIRQDPRTKYLPVVILTSSKEQDDVVKSYQLGVNSYIRKPVDFDKFVDAVKSLGLYWLVLNENPYDSIEAN